MDKANMVFHSDAGHGWLEVPLSELARLNIEHKISGCSYVKGNKVYLEEDCDMATYAYALRADDPNFQFNNLKEVYSEDSPIRNYQRYVKPRH